jgi:hypothetical protein
MRRAALFLALALLTAPAYAGSDEFDIRLGKAPPPPPPVDRSKVSAVERFLSGRQAGSREPGQRAAARALLACKADDATLYGPKGATLAAYDFHDAAIKPEGRGAFTVAAYLLFANKEGVVLESRDETLRFAARGKGYVCTSIQLTNAMTWDGDGVARAADAIGAAEALVRADSVLHAWATRERGAAAYSVADIRKSEDGRVLVQCLRFTAQRGRRGFDAKDSTLVLHKDGSGYSVDAN